MSMTDQEAIARAQKELNTSSYIAETGSTAGLRTMHQNRVCWLLRVLRLAKIALREQEERRWIPVTERLPEEHKSVVPGLGMVSKPVLVTWVDPFSKKAYPGNSFVREGITRNGEFTLNHINGDLVPVAWMPQPKPYEPPKGD